MSTGGRYVSYHLPFSKNEAILRAFLIRKYIQKVGHKHMPYLISIVLQHVVNDNAPFVTAVWSHVLKDKLEVYCKILGAISSLLKTFMLE